MTWTTAADLSAEVQKLWDKGRLLSGIVDEVAAKLKLERRAANAGESVALCSPSDLAFASIPRVGGFDFALESDGAARRGALDFPLALRFRKPSPSELGVRFDDVRAWIKDLETGSRATTGSGYDIVWEEVDNRLLGRNDLPKAIIVSSRFNALAMIGACEQAVRFEQLAFQTLTRFPELCEWLRRNPRAVLYASDSWDQVLEVIAWFRLHPRSGLYIRQIDVLGVDTKFIEHRKILLSELLDITLPPETVDASCSASAQFEARYGLAVRPSLIRFRILDPHIKILGLSDLTVRVDEFARLQFDFERVFIVENEITGLAFSPCEKGIVIFGGGYAIELLAALPWLRTCEVHYWGDIDTHGFAILDRLRAFLPDSSSLFMDRQTLLEYRKFWSFEKAPFVGTLSRLTEEEQALYDDLRLDRLGRGVRLEQERIPLTRFADAECPL